MSHLWQSTWFAIAVGLLTLALRHNRAAVRYALWLAASIKFLLPFSLLVDLGNHIPWRTVSAARPLPWFLTTSAPSALPPPHPPTPASTDPLPALLFFVWFCGFAASLFFWRRSWRQTRAALRAATPLPLHLPIPAVSSPARIEPGVFGIRRPVLLLPEGIAGRLTPAQLEAVIAHELCHVRRRDNLTGAIHLLAEAVFWFHPIVWWIRARLVEERERACDEAVLRAGREPQVYAQGILNVCKFYVESPLVCVSGIGGSNLERRIAAILAPPAAQALDRGRKLLLTAAALAATAGPFAIGLLHAPPLRSQPQEPPALAFEVASVKPNKSGGERSPSEILPGGRFTATNNTVRALILNAYGIFGTPDLLLEGGPAWIDSARYDIDAKAEAHAIPAGTPSRVLWEKTRLMLRALLAERFHLVIRRVTKEMPVYQIVVAARGPKLQPSAADCGAGIHTCHGFSGSPRRLSGTGVDMSDLAVILSVYSDRPVSDNTGIPGIYDIQLQWNVFFGRPRPQPADDAPHAPGAEGREGPLPDPNSLPSLSTALEEQLGLRLESRKGPVEIYVIEHIERPSEN